MGSKVNAEEVLSGEELEEYHRSEAAKRVSKVIFSDPHDPDWYEHAIQHELEILYPHRYKRPR
jgi:hypothetical protein